MAEQGHKSKADKTTFDPILCFRFCYFQAEESGRVFLNSAMKTEPLNQERGQQIREVFLFRGRGASN